LGGGVKDDTMKTPKLIAVTAVSAGLAFGVAAQAKEHEEQNISTSDVPTAVQQAAEAQAKGGKIVRWEKEGANYEAVVEKNGKEWGFAFDSNGKFLKKHDESTEHKTKGEKD
jgi:plastocyanin